MDPCPAGTMKQHIPSYIALVRAVYHSNREETHTGGYGLEIKPSMFGLKTIMTEEQERLIGKAVPDLPGPVVQV